MVGDYISTSFSGGLATPVFAVGHQATSGFEEAMYAPKTPLAVVTPGQASHASSSQGAGPITGVGIGTAHHALD
jgi:hypothetical protein